VSVLHGEFATKALASSARGPRPTSARDQVQLRQNQTRSSYSGTAVTHLPVSPEVLKDIGRAEQCLVPTGATGLQEERLELHEVGAPEAIVPLMFLMDSHRLQRSGSSARTISDGYGIKSMG
jgi:hypothetical protein